MNSIDIEKYKIKEIIQEQDHRYDDIIKYLSGIINDRNIPEHQKQSVRKQFDEVMKSINITMKPPTIVLVPKDSE